MELGSYNKSSLGRTKQDSGKNESAFENSMGALYYYRDALVFRPGDGAGG
jgi:hypothetical protein